MFVCPFVSWVMSRNRPIAGIGPALWPPAKEHRSLGSQNWSLSVLAGNYVSFDGLWIIRGDVRWSRLDSPTQIVPEGPPMPCGCYLVYGKKRAGGCVKGGIKPTQEPTPGSSEYSNETGRYARKYRYRERTESSKARGGRMKKMRHLCFPKK